MSNNIRNSIWYSSGQYINMIVKFIFNLYTIRLLGPTITGSFAFVNVFNTYIDFLYAPIRATIEREIPLLRGASSDKDVNKLLNVSHSTVIINSLIGSLILLVSSFFYSNHYIKYGILIMVPTNFFVSLANYYRIYLKTEKEFVSISKIYILVGIVQAVITLILTIMFSYKGYALGLLFGGGLMYILYKRNINIKFKFYIDLDGIKNVFILGIPLTIYSFVLMNFENIDKIMIHQFLDIGQLGLYNIGSILFSNLWIIPLSVYGVYYPNLMEIMGSQNDKLAIQKVEDITSIVRSIMVPVIGISWICIPILFNYVIPEYKEGIFPCQLLLIGLYFNSLYYMHYCYITGKRKIKSIIYFSLLSLFIKVLLNYIFIKLGLGLTGVSLTTSIMYFIFSSGMIFIGYNLMEISVKKYLILIGWNLIFSIPIFLLIIVDYFISIKIILLKAIVVLVFFTCIELPFFIFSDRKNKLIFKIRSTILKK